MLFFNDALWGLKLVLFWWVSDTLGIKKPLIKVLLHSKRSKSRVVRRDDEPLSRSLEFGTTFSLTFPGSSGRILLATNSFLWKQLVVLSCGLVVVKVLVVACYCGSVMMYQAYLQKKLFRVSRLRILEVYGALPMLRLLLQEFCGSLVNQNTAIHQFLRLLQETNIAVNRN